MNAEVAKDKYISRLVDRENFICVRINKIKNYKLRQWSIEAKEDSQGIK